jgi:hypothetical protein
MRSGHEMEISSLTHELGNGSFGIYCQNWDERQDEHQLLTASSGCATQKPPKQIPHHLYCRATRRRLEARFGKIACYKLTRHLHMDAGGATFRLIIAGQRHEIRLELSH